MYRISYIRKHIKSSFLDVSQLTNSFNSQDVLFCVLFCEPKWHPSHNNLSITYCLLSKYASGKVWEAFRCLQNAEWVRSARTEKQGSLCFTGCIQDKANIWKAQIQVRKIHFLSITILTPPPIFLFFVILIFDDKLSKLSFFCSFYSTCSSASMQVSHGFLGIWGIERRRSAMPVRKRRTKPAQAQPKDQA